MKQASGAFSLFSEQRFFDMLVDIRAKLKLVPLSVTLSWVEGDQLQRHGRQSYLGKINDKYDYLEKLYWWMKERISSASNQLFDHSTWTISLKGEVSAYVDIQKK